MKFYQNLILQSIHDASHWNGPKIITQKDSKLKFYQNLILQSICEADKRIKVFSLKLSMKI
jgi:hypothetical protein